MGQDCLEFLIRPNLNAPNMVLGFQGWMDGGQVSTGSIEYLVNQLDAQEFARIRPEEYYLSSFPGSMEFAALFRPHVIIEDGLLTEYNEPVNSFYFDKANRLILYLGKEPHLHWRRFADCIFRIVEEFGVESIYFIGSVAGLTPHTREPKVSAVVSSPALKEIASKHHVKLSHYNGPGSITSYLLKCASERGVSMINFIAETPAYVQGRNPKCIEAIVKRLCRLLSIDVSLEHLRAVSDEMERRISEIIANREELAAHIQMLEENYDKEIFEHDMDDLRTWLQQQGIRLD